VQIYVLFQHALINLFSRVYPTQWEYDTKSLS